MTYPDTGALITLAWQRDTAVVLCSARRGDMGAATPRDALARVLGVAADRGIATMFGPELKCTLQNSYGAAPFGMDQWYSSAAIDAVGPFVAALYHYLPDMDIPVCETFNEHGAGQMEINLRPASGMQAWDRVML